ncbi:unnamed protein product, partial [Laminaria digitata]
AFRFRRRGGHTRARARAHACFRWPSWPSLASLPRGTQTSDARPSRSSRSWPTSTATACGCCCCKRSTPPTLPPQPPPLPPPPPPHRVEDSTWAACPCHPRTAAHLERHPPQAPRVPLRVPRGLAFGRVIDRMRSYGGGGCGG